MLWLRCMRIGLMGGMCQCQGVLRISRCKNKVKRHLLCNICDIICIRFLCMCFHYIVEISSILTTCIYHIHHRHHLYKYTYYIHTIYILYSFNTHTQSNIFNPIPPFHSSSSHAHHSLQHPLQPEPHKILTSISSITISSNLLHYLY